MPASRLPTESTALLLLAFVFRLGIASQPGSTPLDRLAPARRHRSNDSISFRAHVVSAAERFRCAGPNAGCARPNTGCTNGRNDVDRTIRCSLRSADHRRVERQVDLAEHGQLLEPGVARAKRGKRGFLDGNS